MKPMPTSNERKPYSFGPLYDLLVQTFPENRSAQGIFNIPGLAGKLDVSHETIYRAVRKDFISVPLATKLILLSHDESPMNPLTPADMLPFLFPAELFDA